MLKAGAHSPQNDARVAAQKTMESLPLKAELLSALLQPPSLGPVTPSPVSKRAKIGKEGPTPSPQLASEAIQGAHTIRASELIASYAQDKVMYLWELSLSLRGHKSQLADSHPTYKVKQSCLTQSTKGENDVLRHICFCIWGGNRLLV